MNRIQNIKFFIVALGIFLFSCEKSDYISEEVINEDDLEINFSDGLTKLGEALPDPYALENMQQAYNQLIKEGVPQSMGIMNKSDQLEATHIYLRFLPSSIEEFYMLTDSFMLELFDHCLLREVIEAGSYYHDPELDVEQGTWQYTVVSIDFQIPDINHEIIHYSYIPDESEMEKNGLLPLFYAMESKSVELFRPNDYLTHTEKSRRTPQGTMRYVDPFNGSTRVAKGLTIRCNYGTRIARGVTNNNRWYRVDRDFRYSPYYRAFFYRGSDWSIKNNLIAVADAYNTYLGRQSNSGYNKTFTSSDGRARYFCLISTAAHDYYSWCEDNNILKPPSNLRIWAASYFSGGSAPMLKRGVTPMYKGSVGHREFLNSTLANGNATIQLLNAYTNGVPDITLDRTSSTLYRTTIHELAHASHFRRAGLNYWNTYASYVVTSYADGHGVYGNASLTNSGVCGVGEMWGYYIGGVLATEYYGEGKFNGTGRWFRPQILNEIVALGITEKQIFDCLTSNVRSHQQLRNRLIQNYGRQQQITGIFENWGF